MNQLSPGPHDSQPTGPDTTAGTATAASSNAAAQGTSAVPGKSDATTNGAAKFDAVAGPFTIRDLTVFGSTLLMFVASLLPMFGSLYNLWNLGNLFFLLLGIILPLVVVALFVARRLQPGTIIRVGSLSIDQFASVTASFAFPLFFLTLAIDFNGSVLLGLIGSVGLLAATVLAPHLPLLSADFKGRAETPAHVVAREAAVPSRKPVAPKAPKEPKAPKPTATTSTVTPGAANAGAGYQGSSAAYPASGPAATAASAAGPGAGAPGTGNSATGSANAVASPFAPPATYGSTPSPVTEAPAVVHSADSKPVGEPADGPEAAAVSEHAGSATSPERADAVKDQPTAEESADSRPVAAEPATTQHPQQPAAQQPAAPQTGAQQAATQQPWAATMATPIVSGDTRKVSDSIGATVDPASRPEESDAPQYEAFWFAVAQPRTAYDEQSGAPAFVIEPGGWVLALEDRGHEFLVQDTDGKVGVLRELSNIERG
ncbi:integral membrane protein [Arthrobacter sp. MWB30]|nr:integral membrane protein [Arthrobacter sp. MWB30]